MPPNEDLREQRPAFHVGLGLEYVALGGGDVQDGTIRAAEGAVGGPDAGHRVGLDDPALGVEDVDQRPGPEEGQPAVATMLPSRSKHIPSMPRWAVRPSVPKACSMA